MVGPSGCGKTTLLELICGLQEPDGGTIGGEPAVLMPQRDLLLPWLSALDNAVLASANRGRVARTRARTWGGPFRGVGPTVASSEPGRASCRAGCASAWRSCARCCREEPVLCLDEPLRRTGRDHQAGDAGVAGWSARTRAEDGGARDPRRGGGDRARRPSRRPLAASRPGGGRACDRHAPPARAHRAACDRDARAGAGGAPPGRDEALRFRAEAGSCEPKNGRPTRTRGGRFFASAPPTLRRLGQFRSADYRRRCSRSR